MNKSNISIISLLSMLTIGHLNAQADWTMLTIMQADNNLAPFAVQNISDIQKNISGTRVNKLVYWHKPRSKQRIKCRISPTGMVEEEVIEIKTTPNMEQEIIDAMHWAVSKYPAQHYMLNLWDHGTGIIDQQGWNAKAHNQMRSGFSYGNSWLEIFGLSTLEDRGILYSDSTRTFLSNQQLAQACKHIKEKILGRNIDILGMDACVMAMIEVAYQVKDYAHYLVSSQNLEPGRGWNYGSFLKQICTASSITPPLSAAKAIVDSYAQYYSGRYTFYTLSAIDLGEISELKKNLDTVIDMIFKCHTTGVQNIFSYVKQSATTATKFDSFEFIDLHSLYANMLKAVKTRLIEKKRKGLLHQLTAEQELYMVKLREALDAGYQHITKTVTSNRVGPSFNTARGISIYYPHGHFHPSYARTRFATDTSWAYLVQAANLQNVHIKQKKR